MSACVCRFVHLTFEASLPGRPAPEDGASASASAAVADSKTNRLPYGHVTSQLSLREPDTFQPRGCASP
jgi:hypothetical protein